MTPDRRAQFTTLVGQAFREWLNNRISERLQNALDGVTPGTAIDAPASPPAPAPAIVETAATPEKEDDGIVTTEEELEAFHIVRAILAQVVDPKRVFLKDTRSYCGVLLDFNVRKPLCRFLFNNKQTTLILLDKERNEKKISLESIVDIYKHAAELFFMHPAAGTAAIIAKFVKRNSPEGQYPLEDALQHRCRLRASAVYKRRLQAREGKLINQLLLLLWLRSLLCRQHPHRNQPPYAPYY